MIPQIIELPKYMIKRELILFEYPNQLPFEIQRTYWIYDVPWRRSKRKPCFQRTAKNLLLPFQEVLIL